MGKLWPMVIPRVDWTARRIADPTDRLRFLRASAPAWQKTLRPRKFSRRPVVLSLVAIAAFCTQAWFALVRGRLEASRQRQSVLAAGLVRASVDVTIPSGMALPKPGAAQQIWQVEKTAVFETYSNGLRIDNRYSTGNHPRSYLAFDSSSGDTVGQRRITPAGIVFHTTESFQEPFEPAENGKLKNVGESLLDYVKRRKAYNFVIDRFGRVFRVVREADAAEHAGYSVWSDEAWLYINLNESFLGVSLETRTQPGQMDAAVTAAQIRATAMLTEMLRARFRIPARNCVTHAQVSVSPLNMLAGYHMDWASSFPFEEIGLPNNYALPLPSVAVFGFEYDANYSLTGGARLSEGAGMGDRDLAKHAADAGMGVDVYRKRLQQLYRQRLAATRRTPAIHAAD